MNIEVNKILNEIKLLEKGLCRVKDQEEKICIYLSLNTLYKVYENLTNIKYNKFQVLNSFSYAQNYVSGLNEEHIKDNELMKEFHYEVANQIVNIYKNISFVKHPYSLLKEYPKEEMLSILFDFFYKSDNSNYELVKKVFNNNYIDIRYNKMLNKFINANCYRILKLNKSYILCTVEQNDLYTMSMIVHELGHVIANEKAYNLKPKRFKKTNYTEVLSTFYEKLFLEYCYDKSDNQYDSLYILNMFYSKIINNFSYIKKHLENKLEIDNALLQKITYGYGMLLGNYYYNKYKEKPVLTLRILDEFAQSIWYINNNEILKKFDLSNLEQLKLKEFKNQLAKHSEKIKKLT